MYFTASKNRFYLSGLLCGLLIGAHAPAAETRSVTVATARGLNVRTADGEFLCAVPDKTTLTAIGRHGDGDRIKVKITSPGCKGVKEGFVSSNFVRADDGRAQESLVEPEALSLRGQPNLNDKYWECSLPRDTRVTVLPNTRKSTADARWVKVKVLHPVQGCDTNEGYVAEAYLKGVDQFEDLPLVAGTQDENDVADCSGEGCRDNDRRDRAVKSMEGLSRKIGRKIADEGTPGPFVDGLKKMLKNRRAKPEGLNVSRGLAQLPLKGNRGPCGSFHYNADRPLGVDAYANPLTACVFTAVMQEWKKDFCPSHREGCRIQWGDISHKNAPRFNGHMTHTDGYCIDIRPMRNGAFGDSPMTYTSRGYDREMTGKLVNLLKKRGGSAIYFNDTRLGTRAVHGHHNHVHVCFKDNDTTRATCNNLKVDPNVCPELQ
jgi:hypothetical protein